MSYSIMIGPIVAVIVLAVVGVIIKSISSKEKQKQKQNPNQTDYVVKIKTGYIWYMIILNVVLAALIVVMSILLPTNNSSFLPLIIIASVLLALCLFILFIVCRQKIVVKGEEITFFCAFKKSTQCKFDNLTKVVIKNKFNNMMDLQIFIGDKKIMTFNPMQSNCFYLLKKLQNSNIPLFYKNQQISYDSFFE